jgi:hypothetical protein
MIPKACAFVPFFDEFFPLLNMFANEAASDGFSATISATFMFTAHVSKQDTTQRTHHLNLAINLCTYALPQGTAGPWSRAWLYYSHRLLNECTSRRTAKKQICSYCTQTAACLRKT